MTSTATIPQPRPLPVIGNLTDIDAKAPIQSMMRLAQGYGPIFRLSPGGRIASVVS